MITFTCDGCGKAENVDKDDFDYKHFPDECLPRDWIWSEDDKLFCIKCWVRQFSFEDKTVVRLKTNRLVIIGSNPKLDTTSLDVYESLGFFEAYNKGFYTLAPQCDMYIKQTLRPPPAYNTDHGVYIIAFQSIPVFMNIGDRIYFSLTKF